MSSAEISGWSPERTTTVSLSSTSAQRGADRAAGPVGLGLDDGLGPLGEAGGDVVAGRDDHRDPARAGLARGEDRPGDHRPPADGMQHLRQARAHARARAGRHDEDQRGAHRWIVVVGGDGRGIPPLAGFSPPGLPRHSTSGRGENGTPRAPGYRLRCSPASRRGRGLCHEGDGHEGPAGEDQVYSDEEADGPVGGAGELDEDEDADQQAAEAAEADEAGALLAAGEEGDGRPASPP